MRTLLLIFLAIFFLNTSANAQCSVSLQFPTDPTCFGLCNGSALAIVDSTTGPVSFLWSNGTTLSSVFSLCAGPVSVIIIDSLGCTDTSFTTLSQPAPLSTIVTIDKKTCNGSCDGEATVNVLGGTPPYIYFWSNGSTTGPMQSGLCDGNYTVLITDANGCTTATIVSMTPYSTLLTGTTTTSNHGCATCIDTVAITMTAGTAPFTYSWSDGSTGDTLFNACRGENQVIVYDSSGQCFVLFSATVHGDTNQSANISPNPTVVGATCVINNNGSIQLAATGGVAPYNYWWQPINQIGAGIFNLPAGQYISSISDSTGACRRDTITVPTINTCGNIFGEVYFDQNYDCINLNESLNNQALIHVSGLNWTFNVNTQGSYNRSIPYGNYNISHTPLNTQVANFCANNVAVTVSAATPTIRIDFGDTTNFSNFDHSISLNIFPVIALSRARTSRFTLTNSGPNSVGGIAYFVLNPALTYFSAWPPPSLVTTDTVFWNYNNLDHCCPQLFEVTEICPFNISLLGTYLQSCAGIFPVGTDNNLQNNHTCDSAKVVAAYDPNDKRVQPEGIGTNGGIYLLDTLLQYTIRFQNTGNIAAENIYLMDTLSAWLDWNTLEVISASHSYQLDLLSNVVRFSFNDIFLPDSNSNEPASHGFITYRIKQSSSNQINDLIENTAYIYFDYNPPIKTNTTLNTIVSPIGIGEPGIRTSSVFPNPFENSFTIVLEDHNEIDYTLEVIDIDGKLLLRKSILQKTTVITPLELPAGVYFYMLKGKENNMIDAGKLIAY